MIAKNSPYVQAFMFERNSKTWVVYWHTRGKGELDIPVSDKSIALFETPGKPTSFVKQSNTISTVSIDKRRYMVYDMPQKEVLRVLAKSRLR